MTDFQAVSKCFDRLNNYQLIYHTLLSVELRHRYFMPGPFKGLTAVADGRTQQLIKKNGLLFKSSDQGFHLLYSDRTEELGFLSSLKKPLKFTFALKLIDKYLLNYTNLAFDNFNHGLFLSNVNGNTNEQLLHEEPYISDEAAVVFFESKQQLLKYFGGQIQTLKIEDLFDEKIFEGDWQAFMTTLSDEDLFEAGYLRIYADNIPKPLHCYFMTDNPTRIFGIIDLYIGKANERGLNFEDLQGKNFKAIFESRAVKWRYNLINKDTFNYSDFKLFSGRDNVALKETEEVVLLNGQKAYRIESLEPIALKKDYDQSMEIDMLKSDPKAVNGKFRKKIRLPVPDVQSIKVLKTEDSIQAYSEMYIYY